MAAERFGKDNKHTGLGTDYVLDLPRGKDYKIKDVFITVNSLRGMIIKLKTIGQLIPGNVQSDKIDEPLYLETFLPIECFHLPMCKSVLKCNEFSFQEVLVKRTFYYQEQLFESERFSFCIQCGKRETEKLRSYLFDTKQNETKMRLNIKRNLIGGLCCSNPDCRAVIYSYWIDIKHNFKRGFLTPKVSKTQK